MYLYSGSIIFLCYMHLVQMKGSKWLLEAWREWQHFLSLHWPFSSLSQFTVSDRSTDSSESFSNKQNHYVRYGSFYFRMGVTGKIELFNELFSSFSLLLQSFVGFGMGSVIYSGLQFGQYFELSSQKDCNNVLKAIKPLLRIIFVLMQMLFMFSYSNVSIMKNF